MMKNIRLSKPIETRHFSFFLFLTSSLVHLARNAGRKWPPPVACGHADKHHSVLEKKTKKKERSKNAVSPAVTPCGRLQNLSDCIDSTTVWLVSRLVVLRRQLDLTGLPYSNEPLYIVPESVVTDRVCVITSLWFFSSFTGAFGWAGCQPEIVPINVTEELKIKHKKRTALHHSVWRAET